MSCFTVYHVTGRHWSLPERAYGRRSGGVMRRVREAVGRLLRGHAQSRPPGDIDWRAALADVPMHVRRELQHAAPFTMTSPERLLAAYSAAEYVCAAGVSGDIVECGVWRGGSVMAMCAALLRSGDINREIVLFDTFAGMTPPTDVDRTVTGEHAADLLAALARRPGGRDYWCWATREDVEKNVRQTGYPLDRFRYVVGDVLETLTPRTVNGPIAVLRLDTDWYQSTRHELDVLYPKVARNGIVIIDDYGHWEGARKAVDEFLAALAPRPYLHRIDYTGRLFVKQ